MNGQLRDLWEALRLAGLLPEQVDMKVLLAAIDQAVAQTPEVERLQVAGEALLQVAELCAARAEVLTTEWEEAYRDPIVKQGFFADVVRQSMGVDLSDLMEPVPVRKHRVKPTTGQPEGSIVAVVEKEAVLEMVEQLEVKALDKAEQQQAWAVAESEDVSRWVAEITQRLQVAPTHTVALTELCHCLEMSWVEVWLGVLLGGFKVEQVGAFYGGTIWVRKAEVVAA